MNVHERIGSFLLNSDSGFENTDEVSRLSLGFRRILKYAACCLITTVFAVAAHGERKYIMGSQIDFSVGGTNQQTLSSVQFQKDMAPFFGFYPSVNVNSIGERTQLNFAYSALVERFSGNRTFTSSSNIARSSFLKTGHRYKLALSSSFSDNPDDFLVNVITGTVPVRDGFRFIFEPARAQSSRRAIGGTAAAEIALNFRSYLTASFQAVSLDYYDTKLPEGPISSLFLDQIVRESDIGYSYRLDEHGTLNVSYILVANSYSGFGTEKSQTAAVEYIRQLSPVLQITLEGGPSILSGHLQPVSLGYLAGIRILRSFQSSKMSAYYSHSSGQSTGLGSFSDVHYGGLDISSPLWRRLWLDFAISGFTGAASSSDLDRYQGVYGAMSLSYPLGRRWYFSIGGSYRLNEYNVPLDREFKRAFASLRFRAPDLWRSLL